MGEHLGMVSLADVTADVRYCLDRGDVTAFSAVWARLLRIAERSLSPDKIAAGSDPILSRSMRLPLARRATGNG